MTLTFKDPNGDEWGLLAWSRSDDRRHPATAADLLSALGQLATGSDGPPTMEDIQSAYDAAYLAAELAGERYPHDDAKRSLYNAGRAEGLALGEQKLKAQSWRHVPDTHEVIPKGRHDWVLKSELDAAKAEVDRLTARVAEQRGRIFALTDELAATKAKLAETEAESEKYRLGMQENCQLRSKLAEVEREMSEVGAIDGARASLNRIGATRGSLETRAYVAAELYDSLLAENAQTEAELASARRVVEPIVELAKVFPPGPSREFCGYNPGTLVRAALDAADALASAGTDADRAEAPRPEAGESGHDPHHDPDPECSACGHVASDHRPGGCGACCEDEESGDSAKCDCRRFREEEPKPEPQQSGEES